MHLFRAYLAGNFKRDAKLRASGFGATSLMIMNEDGVPNSPNWHVPDIYFFPKHPVPAPRQRAMWKQKPMDGKEMNSCIYTGKCWQNPHSKLVARSTGHLSGVVNTCRSCLLISWHYCTGSWLRKVSTSQGRLRFFQTTEGNWSF